MSIVFTISNQPAAVPGQELSHTFTDGGTIGRTRTCDWVLIDASRFISGKHAVISEQNGTYQITDTSTNGVFINDAKVPLGKGNSAILNQGDNLKIGEYVISVSINGQQAVPGPQDQVAPGFGQPPPMQQDLMAGIGGGGGESVDPLDLFKTPKKAAAVPPTPRPPAAESGLIPSSKPEPIYPSTSQEDHAASVHNHFEPPNIIPDNWLDEESRKSKSAEPPPQQIPPISEIQQQKTRDNMRASGAQPAPSGAQLKQPPKVPELTNGTSGFFRKKKVKKASRPTTGAPSAVSNQVVQSFLSGLGVENVKLTTEQLPSFMRVVGECVRECISGTFNVLRSRTNIKSEFRMSMTTIQAVENNPLKFSVNVDEAVRNMFLNTSESYLPPMEAIREGFEDIEGHQLAVMAGTQAAIVALLKRFDPKYLEETFESGKSRGGILSGGKKAKYWDSYEDYYQEIAARVEDNFQNMFGDEFAQAYENQVQRLLGSRRKVK